MLSEKHLSGMAEPLRLPSRKGVFLCAGRTCPVIRPRAGRAEKAEPAERAERGRSVFSAAQACACACGVWYPCFCNARHGFVPGTRSAAAERRPQITSPVRRDSWRGGAEDRHSCMGPGLFRERLTPASGRTGGFRHRAGRHALGMKYTSAARGVLRGRKASPETEGFVGISMLLREAPTRRIRVNLPER